jgi:autocrine motility factor receptor
LDQGLNEVYSCPTCRKPLFVGRTESEANPSRGEVSSDEHLARQFERQNNSVHALTTGMFPTETPNFTESDPWRNSEVDPSWLQTWSDQGVDVVGSSAGSRSVGLGQVQLMMRHLASVGEGSAQTTLDDASWGLWPMNPSQASTSSTYVPPGAGGRTGGLHLRTVSRAANNMASILAMAETVREVLPHVPDEIIFQVNIRCIYWYVSALTSKLLAGLNC